MKKKVFFLFVTMATMICLAGCSLGSGKKMQGAPDNEIITAVPVDQNKTMITVRVEFGAGQQDNLEEVLEEKFPDVDIVLRHDGSDSSVYTVRANLEAGVECDLILSRRLPAISDIAEQYLYDLSSETFVDNYYMNAVDSCAETDGKLYYLPGPSDVYGIVYDKTVFEDNGWKVPTSYSEFIELLNTIKGTKNEEGQDIVPLQISLMYPDMFQIIFNTYGYEDVYGGKDNFVWLTEYQNGNGSMVGHMEKAADNFKKLFEDGVLSVGDFDITPGERSKMLYVDHTAAMTIECQNAVTYVNTVNETYGENDDIHEVAMMPFWTSDDENGDFLYVIPSYYMAINKSSAEESADKKQILLDIYAYLSSVEGQNMLIGDSFQLSNISGVPVNSNDFSQEIQSTIERGQLINTFYLADGETNKQVERQLLSNAKDMVTGSISVEEWLTAADKVRDSYLAGEMSDEKVYGESEETLTRLESAYTVAGMYASLMNTPIGICRGGAWENSTNGYIYKGDITDSSISCISPDNEVDADDENAGKIVKSFLTGSQIMEILNVAAEPTTTKGLSSYYVAWGLDVEYAPWAADGERVISCRLADGSEIEPDAVYEVAYFNGSLPIADVEAESALDMSWQDAFLEWLDENGGVVKKPEMTLKLVYDIS
jgi:ABC-type glycerol-3-phosphate transport system substrate-binding protein